MPNITETSGNVEINVTELIKGQASGEKIQLLIQNKPTVLFNPIQNESLVKK